MTGAEVTALLNVLKANDKELPDWYGIKGIKFIWHNEWADPEIEYKGRRCNCFIVEDTMWYDYTHDDEDNEIPSELCPEDGFEKYMRENADVVRELCELVLFKGGK